MTTYSERNELWSAVTNANTQHYNLLDIQSAIQILSTALERNDDSRLQEPISPELTSLVTRAKRLSDDFHQHEQEIAELFQKVVWGFVETEWNLLRGDRIEYTNWQGNRHILIAEVLHVRGLDLGDLSLVGHIVKKNGKPGKKEDWLQLIQIEWVNLSKQERAKTEPAR